MAWNETLNKILGEEGRPLKAREIALILREKYPEVKVGSLRVMLCNFLAQGLIFPIKHEGCPYFYWLHDTAEEEGMVFNPLLKKYETQCIQ